MSLTSHIRNANQSPVGQFLRQRFPQTAIITKETNTKLRASKALLPPTHPWPYDKIGLAIDYRIRYCFDITPSRQLIAWAGAHMLPYLVGDEGELIKGPYSLEFVGAFFTRLDAFLETIHPVGRKLESEAERDLARYCFVLALFEEVFREGVDGRTKDGPLFVPEPKQSFEELLAIAEDAWIDDLCQLTALFHEKCQHLLLQPFNLNPTFAGSGDVGGADADLIADGCLIEIKTSKQMQIDADWLHQLVGYVLLDYNDEHHINSVGIYMVRQGLLFTWPLADFLRLLTTNVAISLPLLRQEFSDLCKNRRIRIRRQ
jgi:hypothetical protein